MSPVQGARSAQLNDLLETLWNLEDIHRELVERMTRLIRHLEEQELAYASFT